MIQGVAAEWSFSSLSANRLQNLDNRCKIKVLQRFFFVYTSIA